jgi:hypothetical protein
VSVYLIEIGWLILLLLGLAVLQRRVHFEFQAIFLLLTKRADLSILLFSIVFLPGVLLHETSHFLSAKLLRVPTGRFSILPRPLPGGKLQLGYVETYQTDIFRDALIGIAPLITGLTVIAFISYFQFDIILSTYSLNKISLTTFMETLDRVYGQPDFWLWFYFIFVISSTMFPSASDRRSWLPMILLLFGILMVFIFMGAGPWMMDILAPGLSKLLLGLSLILGLSVLSHIVLLIPLWMLRLVFVRMTGMRVA